MYRPIVDPPKDQYFVPDTDFLGEQDRSLFFYGDKNREKKLVMSADSSWVISGDSRSYFLYFSCTLICNICNIDGLWFVKLWYFVMVTL